MKARIERILTEEPSIKAKDIAKKLNMKRTEINSYLYKYPEIYKVDGNYCWTLISPDELTIEFEGDSWVHASSFESSLAKAGSSLDVESKKVKFLLPKNCSILLEASARLLALSNQLVQSGREVTIDFSNCNKTLSYFDRMGFFDSLDNKVMVLPNRPRTSRAKRYKGNSSNVVEFGIISPANESEDDLTEQDKQLIMQLTDSFVSKTSDHYEGVATAIFSELIGNIKSHSETTINGFAAFQSYGGNTPHIQTIVSDSGLGIAKTLKSSISVNYPDVYRRLVESDDFDIRLVLEALTKGQISRHGKGRGLGFEITSKKAMKFNVKLSARQETFSIQVQYLDGQLSDVQVTKDLPRILGTHICFDFMID